MTSMLLSLILGAVSVTAFAPLEVFPIAWLTTGGLFFLLVQAPDVRSAFARGFAHGLGIFLAGVSWVFVSLNEFGGLPTVPAALATLLFCAFLALFPALWSAAFVRIRSGKPFADVLAFAACWSLSEWTRGWLFTGFPWLTLGYSQSPPSPLSGFAPVVGVYGVSFFTVVVGAGLVGGMVGCHRETISLSSPPKFRLALSTPTLLCVVCALAVGYFAQQHRWTWAVGQPLRVALLQGNISQDVKWQPGHFADSLAVYFELTKDHPAQLSILPETAIPSYFHQIPKAFLGDLARLVQTRGGDLLLGTVLGDDQNYANIVVTLGASPPQVYSKHHLVPFGEFVPSGFGWFVAALRMPKSNFSPGTVDQIPLAVSGQQVAVNICYEDLFGEEIIRSMPHASILANVSNTAWFGRRSLAQPQHLQISQMRALETGRPMLRATNTGMTAVVLPTGLVDKKLPPFVRGALVADVQGYAGTTPYARFGNGLVLILAVAALLFSMLARTGWRSETSKRNWNRLWLKVKAVYPPTRNP
ncbi:MAG: apolipoprotein N-acyltransferase [Gammaproteobacteria bacterium]|nr:apolipoprotein N-acyltransferase [Gammaproteobacteria bacterium]MBU1602010.1 apolipoprotein N-acyltransferase [Gammaproteobacteria bacterium]MBU2433987.1 apolipoprotein N-acyltransferase [Gammaproteobacteria bacterium]MBU2447811.1 apolipoprotein N-acyltransferase [Gammaproteobacteria bacterium]